MKKTYLLILMMGLTAHLFAQCPYELEVESQQDIDDYLQQHSDCHLLYNLNVKDSLPKNMTELFLQLDTIYGINIINTKIKYLDITGIFNNGLFLEKNDSLRSVTVGNDDGPHYFVFSNNKNLLTATLNCNNIQEFYIKTDTLLTIINTNSKTKIKKIFAEGNVVFTGEKAKIYDDLQIFYNNLLKSTNQILEHLTIDTINNLFILDCEEFNVAGIEKVASINKLAYVNIKNLNILPMANAHLTNLNLALYSCPTVSSLYPFNNCTISSLTLVEMDKIQTLAGINFTKKILGVKLVRNDILEDISAISVVDSFENLINNKYLEVYENKNLDFCSYKSICYLLTHPEFSYIDVHNNLNECESQQKIIETCTTNVLDQSEDSNSSSFISPYFNFENLTDVKEIYVFDIMGRQYKQPNLLQKNVDFTSLTSGLYFINITFHSKKPKIYKVIKL